MSKRRVFTTEFKQEAVRLAKENGNLSATARNLGLNIYVLQRWKQASESQSNNPFPGNGNPQDPELTRLKRENSRLQEEVEILKKAVGIFTKPPR